jgi:hypothetical protein
MSLPSVNAAGDRLGERGRVGRAISSVMFATYAIHSRELLVRRRTPLVGSPVLVRHLGTTRCGAIGSPAEGGDLSLGVKGL